jgi:hypothetical protein
MNVQTTSVKARTLWQLLALDDAELEATDLVEMNLSVAREIPSLEKLDVPRYCRIVDQWTNAFRNWLPSAEKKFRDQKAYFKNDIRFFRVGMLASYMGKFLGIRYIESQKTGTSILYTNPSDLFLNGLIDTKQGSCGNMAALHVAMSRRMGWPVSLACANSHFLSRFNDGDVIHNIEATHVDETGAFISDPDDVCMKVQKIPQKAVDCGSDLRSLTAREMMGVFIGQRARHFRDAGDFHRADLSYSLSRALFYQHRKTFIGAMIPMLSRAGQLFDSGEIGHPDTFFECYAPMFAEDQFHKAINGLSSGIRCFPIAFKPLPMHEVINGLVMNRQSWEPLSGEQFHERNIGQTR